MTTLENDSLAKQERAQCKFNNTYFILHKPALAKWKTKCLPNCKVTKLLVEEKRIDKMAS
jgi:hypothetical protein